MARGERGSGSPWSSSTFLPFGIPSRRNSVSSLSSRAGLDRDTISSALDNIHSSASRVPTLVTFNDYAAPPPAPKGLDGTQSPGGFGRWFRSNKPTPISASGRKHGKTGSEADRMSAPPTPSVSSLHTHEHDFASPAPSPRRPPTSDSQHVTSPSNPNHAQQSSGVSSFDLQSKASQRSVNERPRSVASRAKEARIRGDHNRDGPKDSDNAVADDSNLPVSRSTGTDHLDQTSRISRSADKSTKGSQLSDETARAQEPSEHSRGLSTKMTTPPLVSEGTFKRPPVPRFPVDKFQPRGSPPAALTKINVAGSNTSDAEFEDSSAKSSTQTPTASRSPSRPPQPQDSNTLLHEMRRKVLSRDFWMKDENAKVCFNCGDGFTAFRRKHHCRTCGQIYDAKCTVLIPGRQFGQPGKLRICKTCENMIVGDESSEYSEDEEAQQPPSHGKSIRFSGLPSALPQSHSRVSLVESPAHHDPTRSTAETRRRSTLNPLENLSPALTRPSSSRSLKSLGGRPMSSNHRHRRSLHQHMRSFPSNYTNATLDESNTQEPTSAGSTSRHPDEIIDPDIAPFVSDEGSSDDEPFSIASAINGNPNDVLATGAHTASRKSRPRPSSSRSIFDLSLHPRDPETASIRSSRPGTRRRTTARTMSMGSAMAWPPMSPRIVRSGNLFTDGQGFFGSTTSLVPDEGNAPQSDLGSPKDSTAEPSLAELNASSLNHVRALLRQLLKDVNIKHPQRWEKVLVPLLLRCAEEIDPNIQRGDDIDIRHYIKLKKVPRGQPHHTKYISGVVFSKNMALKGMKRSIPSARLLLVSFPIVYARHQQHFMSLDAVIAQEKEYLRNLVRRIVALRPDVVLAQKQIAGIALELLRDAGLTVAYNVKESVLHAVSRCTHSRIITSVDKLTMDAKHLGSCENFEIKTFSFGTYKKTYFFVSGCQNDLGCTIVLRGGDLQTLTMMKWITEFMCYVVYNLKLETSLIRDQFSSASSVPPKPKTLRATQGPSPQAMCSSEEVGNSQRDTAEVVNVDDPKSESPREAIPERRVDTPMTEFGKVYHRLDDRILSISPSVTLAKPHLLMQGLESEQTLHNIQEGHRAFSETLHEKSTSADASKFLLVDNRILDAQADALSSQERETLLAIRSAEHSRADQHYAVLRRRWESFIAGSRDPFSPLSHQQIVILFSVISQPSLNACEGPDLLSIGFYQEHNVENDWEPDMPLGEYVERLCEQANAPCLASRCDKKMVDHQRHYVHGDGQVRIVTKPLAAKVRGMESTILMWSVCRDCSQETPVVPMSRNTWKYSFAKYLELTFWSRKIEPRAGICPHSINRSHKRYFGFHNLAVCVEYEQVNVMEVTMPRNYVSWLVEKDLPMKNEEFLRIKDRLERFLNSVTKRIKSIKLESVRTEDLEKCKLELEQYQQRAKDERVFLMDKLEKKYVESKYFEIIPLNRAVRALQEKVGEWDRTFADFERRYFPSEKDIRKLAAQQLKNAYLARSELTEKEQFDEKDVKSASALPTDEKFDRAPSVIDAKGTQLHKDTKTAPDSATLNSTTSLSSIQQMNESAKNSPSRMFDELDLAESPNTSATRRRVDAGLSIPRIEGNDDKNLQADIMPQSEPSETGVSSLYNEIEANDHEKAKSIRRHGRHISPVLTRSHTQPTSSDRSASPSPQLTDSNKHSPVKTTMQSFIPVAKGIGQSLQPFVNDIKQSAQSLNAGTHLSKTSTPSMIPRSTHRVNSKVTALARHFEQMSREFERERLRERRQRAARVQQAQVHSTASVQPVVEVFKDAQDAFIGRDNAGPGRAQIEGDPHNESRLTSEALAETAAIDNDNYFVKQKLEGAQYGSDSPEDVDGDHKTVNRGHTLSDTDLMMSDVEPAALTDSEDPPPAYEAATASSGGSQADFVDIPKHDKVSIMKMLSSFWSERSASGWAALEYPLAWTDHIFGDQDVILREDELSSLIAFSLESADYKSKCKTFRERAKVQPISPTEVTAGNADMEVALLGETATHLTYRWAAGPARMECRILFAEGFDAMRQRCGVSDRFVESLSRCVKWDSRGGKSRAIFLKTMDERFIVKTLPEIEAQAFVRFAPDYFDYMSRCLFHSLPSALAKMLGLYHVNLRNPVTNVEFTGYLQVMENVYYERLSNRMFDLKGSMRNRRAPSTGERNEVLLDENLLDYLAQWPIYIRNHSNSFLTSSIYNDTLFCAKQNVMDYSLIVGMNDDRHELIVGIIDYIRTYTWDKKLESWIKDRGKNKPTVRSPKEYRNRFRTSIANYFPLAPSCWQIFGRHRAEPSRAFWDSIGMGRADRPDTGSMDQVEEIDKEPE